jgi:2-O-methyltransferase
MKQRWPGAIIHAFEPFPFSFQQLETTTAGLSGVFRWPYALNDQPGLLPFYVVANNDGASSLLAPQEYTKAAYEGPCIIVEALNLDSWAKENHVDHIDFMWLDMEGVELKMLNAAPKILKTVKAIMIETNYWACRIGTAQYPDLKAFLKEKGFEEARHWMAVGQGNAMFVKKEIIKEKSKSKKGKKGNK